MEIIIGAVVSILVQWLKNKFGTDSFWTIGIVAVLSLAAAGIYTFLVAVGYWQEVVAIFITAGAFYTYIIQRFETK